MKILDAIPTNAQPICQLPEGTVCGISDMDTYYMLTDQTRPRDGAVCELGVVRIAGNANVGLLFWFPRTTLVFPYPDAAIRLGNQQRSTE